MGQALERNQWVHLVGDADARTTDTPIRIHADANISVALIDASVSLEVAAGRQVRHHARLLEIAPLAGHWHAVRMLC